jgi:hypothetical protein
MPVFVISRLPLPSDGFSAEGVNVSGAKVACPLCITVKRLRPSGFQLGVPGAVAAASAIRWATVWSVAGQVLFCIHQTARATWSGAVLL